MTFVIYKDSKAQYRWRLKASNGQIIGDSGEGYWNKSDCVAMVASIRMNAATAAVVDETQAQASRW